MKKIYTAIDIGTIKFVVAEKYKDNFNVLAAHEEKSKGIRKGLIVDPNLAINSIKDGIKELRRLLNINIKKVIVNIPDYNSKFMFVTSKYDINNDDEVVTSDDVNNIIDPTEGITKLDDVALVAYDSKGNVVDVEMVPS